MKNLLINKIKPFLLVLILFNMASMAYAGGLKDFSGTAAKVTDYTGKGKWTLVMFWASDCHICNKEAHQYVDFHLVHSDTDATVLGITLDGKARFAEAKGFIKRHNVDFPNLIGEPEDVAHIYMEYANRPWIGTPSFLLFDPKGTLRAQEVGAVPTSLIEEFIQQNSVAAKK